MLINGSSVAQRDFQKLVFKLVSKEVKEMCSKKESGLYAELSVRSLGKFSWCAILAEVSCLCPTWYSAMLGAMFLKW